MEVKTINGLFLQFINFKSETMKLLLLLLFFFTWGGVQAQQISVQSFRKLETDLSARGSEGRTDQNGDRCAIIKIVTTETGFDFDPDALGSMGSIQKKGEVWLYVPYGARRLTIRHARLGILRDYLYPERIEKACVYEMVLTTGTIETIVHEIVQKQYLVVTTEPEESLIYVDNEYVGSGQEMVHKLLSLGKHTYRVEAPMYHTEAGTVELMAEKKSELRVALRPAFGFIKIVTEPENGAQVIVDEELTALITPCVTEKVKSGTHRIKVIKSMYQPVVREVTVEDGKTSLVHIDLQPNFAELTLIGEGGASLWVNGEEKGTGSWKGRVNAGLCSIEQRMPSCRTQRKDIEVKAGEELTLKLEPLVRIYGILDVSSEPAGATIYVDEEVFGTTPNLIQKMGVGEHKIRLALEGYKDEEKTVMIQEGKICALNMVLKKGLSPETVMIQGEAFYQAGNYSEAYICFRKAAEAGNIIAQNWVGILLETGKGVRESKVQAANWYRRAALQGNADAQYHLGRLYENGEGVERDSAQADSWYEKAAAQGQEKAAAALKRRRGERDTFVCGAVCVDPRDGQKYPTIQIGNQCWMAKNMNVGEWVKIRDVQTHRKAGIQKFAYGDQQANNEVYGGLYTWWEAMFGESTSGIKYVEGSWTEIQGICPDGWHIPSEAEWNMLAGNSLGQLIQGMLAGGYRSPEGSFLKASAYGYWWLSTSVNSNEAYGLELESNRKKYKLSKKSGEKERGFSVRCIRN